MSWNKLFNFQQFHFPQLWKGDVACITHFRGLSWGLNETSPIESLLQTFQRADTGQVLYCYCWYCYSLPAGPPSLAQKNPMSSPNRIASTTAHWSWAFGTEHRSLCLWSWSSCVKLFSVSWYVWQVPPANSMEGGLSLYLTIRCPGGWLPGPSDRISCIPCSLFFKSNHPKHSLYSSWSASNGFQNVH